MIVTIAQLGENLNLRERRLYQLKAEGLPRVSPGRYDLRACLRWYVRYLQRKILERSQPENRDSPTAVAGVIRHKMLSIESELKQIELAEKREQLVSVERVQQDLHAIGREIRRHFGELPKKLAAEIVGESDLATMQVKIDRSLKGSLAELSQFDPDEAVEAVTTSAARSSTCSRTQ